MFTFSLFTNWLDEKIWFGKKDGYLPSGGWDVSTRPWLWPVARTCVCPTLALASGPHLCLPDPAPWLTAALGYVLLLP